jgi:hypothetical protein
MATIALWLAFFTAVPPNTCPACRLTGQTSRIRPNGWTTATLMGGSCEYTEDGAYLECWDPNTYTTPLACSRGHEWVSVTHGKTTRVKAQE